MAVESAPDRGSFGWFAIWTEDRKRLGTSGLCGSSTPDRLTESRPWYGFLLVGARLGKPGARQWAFAWRHVIGGFGGTRPVFNEVFCMHVQNSSNIERSVTRVLGGEGGGGR